MHTREREDFKKTYKIFGRMRVAAGPRERERAAAIVGHPPRSYTDYVAGLA